MAAGLRVSAEVMSTAEDYTTFLTPRSRPLSISYFSLLRTRKQPLAKTCGSCGKLQKVELVPTMWSCALRPCQKLYWQTLWPSKGERKRTCLRKTFGVLYSPKTAKTDSCSAVLTCLPIKPVRVALLKHDVSRSRYIL
jgi:hypothetical protein